MGDRVAGMLQLAHPVGNRLPIGVRVEQPAQHLGRGGQILATGSQQFVESLILRSEADRHRVPPIVNVAAASAASTVVSGFTAGNATLRGTRRKCLHQLNFL